MIFLKGEKMCFASLESGNTKHIIFMLIKVNEKLRSQLFEGTCNGGGACILRYAFGSFL